MPVLRFANKDLMPALGLGTWLSEPGKVYEAVKVAIKSGYRHIDCAPIYGNEPEVGKAFQEIFDAGDVKRKEVWVTSKLWNNAHAPEDVKPALEKTLADLKLEYLDLFLIHWPVHVVNEVAFPTEAGHYIAYEDLPIHETWKAMEELVDTGLCRHIGVSNFSIKKLEGLMASCRIKPEMNQIELHPYLQQHNMLKFCAENDIHLTAYAPLGSPARPPELSGDSEPVLLDDPIIAEIAQQHGFTNAQVLLAWAINRGTAVIPKSVTPARIEQNFEAKKLSLSQADIDTINRLDKSRRYLLGDFWTGNGSPYTLENIWDE
ncbi:MAG: aldehyde oxidoreductase [Firmicutes bacterium ML8_F2]|nr:MAG: aldehyde oxidoreductase [Firmicutes bacterium ML8_F2]